MRRVYIRDYKNEVESKIEKTKAVSVIGITTNNNKIFSYMRIKDKNLPTVFLSGTVHGDEPVGVNYLTKFIIENKAENYPCNFVIIPCVNPDGFELGIRENFKGVDLNRDFSKKPKSEEVKIVQTYLKELGIKFKTSIDFHETGIDETGEEQIPDNFYVWEINENQDTRFAHDIIETLYQNRIPTCNWSHIFGDKNNNGAIFYPEDCFSETYSSAESFDVYMKNNYTDQALTTETCIHDNIAYRERVLDIILKCLSNNIKK